MKRNNQNGLKRLAAGSLAAMLLLGHASAAGFTDPAGQWAKSYIVELSQNG